jgi:hypothetical protein
LLLSGAGWLWVKGDLLDEAVASFVLARELV